MVFIWSAPMKSLVKSVLTLSVAVSLLASPAMSQYSLACSDTPILGSVCIMAAIRNGDMNSSYAYADGRIMQISQASALFALLGATYGGNGSSTFALPDLRGRVIVGTNNNPNLGRPLYNIGAYGGSVTLAVGQLPAHIHQLTTSPSGVLVTTGLGTLAANTTMTGLSATTDISRVSASTNISGLTATLKAGIGAATTTGDATNAALPSNNPGSTAKPFYYVGAAPTVSMNSSSVAIGGSATTTLSGTATTTITGSPTTQLSGAPGVSISGVTQATGGTSSTPIMPPYLALHYYIATNGLFPSYD